MFVEILQNTPPPVLDYEDNTEQATSTCCDVIMKTAERCVKDVRSTENQWDQNQPR